MKKIIYFILLLFVFSGCSQSESSQKNEQTEISDEFTELMVVGITDESDYTSYTVIDENFNELLHTIYTDIDIYENGYIAVVAPYSYPESLYTIFDYKGNEIITGDDSILDFFENKDSNVGVYSDSGLIDRAGNILIQADTKYDSIKETNLNEIFIIEDDGKYGIINEFTQELIDCKYDEINDFTDSGYAIVKANSKYGVINSQGEEILPTQYKQIADLEYFLDCEKIAILTKNLELQLYDLKTKNITNLGKIDSLDLNFDELNESLNSSYDYITNKFLSISAFNGDTALGTNKNNQPILVDKNLNIIKTFTYDNIDYIRYTIRDNSAISIENLIYEYYNYSQNIEIQINTDYFIACKDEKYGVIDVNENTIIECIYDQIIPINNQYLLVNKDTKYGIIDYKGNEILSIEYDFITTYKSNEYAIIEKDSLYGITDSNGKQIIDFQYDDVKDIQDQYIIVEKNSKYGVINFDGDILIDIIYESLEYTEYETILAELNGNYGILDFEENIIIPFEYSGITCIENGYIVSLGTSNNETYHFLNENGEFTGNGTLRNYGYYSLSNYTFNDYFIAEKNYQEYSFLNKNYEDISDSIYNTLKRPQSINITKFEQLQANYQEYKAKIESISENITISNETEAINYLNKYFSNESKDLQAFEINSFKNNIYHIEVEDPNFSLAEGAGNYIHHYLVTTDGYIYTSSIGGLTIEYCPIGKPYKVPIVSYQDAKNAVKNTEHYKTLLEDLNISSEKDVLINVYATFNNYISVSIHPFDSTTNTYRRDVFQYTVGELGNIYEYDLGELKTDFTKEIE